MKNFLLPGLVCIVSFTASAQENLDPQKLSPKRFIDKVEFVAGPSLCFNHGNMFVDNFKGNYANGNYVDNKRLTKIAYSVGVGACHPFNNWLDINFRVLWEEKGYKSELNHPLNPVNNNDREIEDSEYTYDYFTLALASRIYLDKKRKYSFSFGGYYSKINNEKGYISYTSQGQFISEGSFKGRNVISFDNNGGVNTSGFAPGLTSFNKGDYGITIGFGYSIRIKDYQNISIQLTDNYGLQNINKQVFIPTLSNPPEKNHTVSLLIGYVLKRVNN